MTDGWSSRRSRVRWIICTLLFLAATINYVDRQVIGLLKTTLQDQFHWTETDYADIIFAFQLAYALGFLVSGRIIDTLGTKMGFALALVLWSAAAIGHAFAPAAGGVVAPALSMLGLGYSTSVAGFMAMRFLLGLGESGSFPASIKTVAEWFPRRERALATGVFNAGTNVGAVLTPLIVPWVTLAYGWVWAFVATGAFGLVWLMFWLPYYRHPAQHPGVSAAELALIQADPPDPVAAISWRRLLRRRQAWAFAVGKFLTDPIWWLYLFWIPDFLSRRYGLSLTSVGLPLIVIYLLADAGSVAGGWLSSRLIAQGWTINRARKTAMLACALAVTPMVFASSVRDVWTAVAIVGLAAAAHQGWSANLFTLTSDTFPRHAVGSVVGFGGTAGAIGGMLIAKVTGYILDATGSYYPIFVVAGATYLVALGVIHLLSPHLDMAEL